MNFSEYPQDTVILTISSEKTLQNPTVRVSVPITAIVTTAESDQAVLNQKIKDTLANFIAAEWSFSNHQRASDTAGYERITLLAVARIKSGENYSLPERAQKASVQGLSLGAPNVDYSFPTKMLEDAATELRIDLAKKAKAEAAALTEAVGVPYRIAVLDFNYQEAFAAANKMRGKSMAYTASFDSQTAGSAPESGVDFAQKVTVTAHVTLAHAFLK